MFETILDYTFQFHRSWVATLTRLIGHFLSSYMIFNIIQTLLNICLMEIITLNLESASVL